MHTANELAELEHDGGGEMSELEIAERFAHAQLLKQDILHNPDTSGLVLWLYEEGHYDAFQVRIGRNPEMAFDALHTLQECAGAYADWIATQQTADLSWAEIQWKNDNAYGQEK